MTRAWKIVLMSCWSLLMNNEASGQLRTNLPKGEQLSVLLDSVLIIDPRTWISIKNNQNEFTHCPEFSQYVHNTILIQANNYFNDSLIWYFSPKDRKEPVQAGFTNYEPHTDSTVTDSIYHFMSVLKQHPSSIKKLSCPEYFTGLIRESGYRYGMLIFQYGFIKSEELYKKQIAGAVLMALLTRGLTGELREFRSELDVCLIDSHTGKLIFYGGSVLNENPLEAQTYTDHFHMLFDHRLKKKKHRRRE